MGGHPVFRNLVHFTGADLHLDRLAVGANHLCVQALVAVGLGGADVVAKQALHGQPQIVDVAQREIALVGLTHDDAQGNEVVNLLERDALLNDLVEDAVEVLGPPDDLGVVQALGFQPLFQNPDRFLEFVFAVLPRLRHRLGDFPKLLGVQDLEREVF